MKTILPAKDWHELWLQTISTEVTADSLISNAHIASNINTVVKQVLLEFTNLVLCIEQIREKSKSMDTRFHTIIEHDARGLYSSGLGELRDLYRGISKSKPYSSKQIETAMMSPASLIQATLSAIQSLQFLVEPERVQTHVFSVSRQLFSASRRAMYNYAFDSSALPSPENKAVQYCIDSDLFVLAQAGLDTLFNNIFRNAYMHGDAKNIVVRAYQSEDTVVFEIADDGRGIADDILPHIFIDGFSAGESSGIGLALADKRLEAMGGSIECIGKDESRLGGATFIIKLQSA